MSDNGLDSDNREILPSGMNSVNKGRDPDNVQ